MKTCSFRDLLKVSWLSKYSEVDLLSIERDSEVNRVLSEIGFDCDYPIEYSYANHRDLSGVAALGFMLAGEVSINRKHLTSRFADLTDIMIASAYTDTSLTFELGELSGKQHCYDNLLSLEDDSERSFLKELVEISYKGVKRQIEDMSKLIEDIRGPCKNNSGSYKTPSEYMEWFTQNGETKVWA